jgi:hypothetical protein
MNREVLTIGLTEDASGKLIPFTLPVDTATEALALLGRRGKGKSTAARVIVEELIACHVPVIVLDTTGVWWGLRSNSAGDGPGLPVVIFGGIHADVPLVDTAGALIADVLMDRRIPAVIDLSSFTKSGMRRFATAFVERVYQAASSRREPLHLVFDEVDEFAGQRARPETATLLGAMEEVVRRGRSRGLGSSLITQRAAVVSKDILTQAGVLVAFAVTHPLDVKAIDDWISDHDDDGNASVVKATLSTLPVGTAWVWAPGDDILSKVRFRRPNTFDSSATPKVGKTLIVPKKLAPIDLDALGAQIAATVETGRAQDPKSLKLRIAELESQLAFARDSVPAAPQPAEPVTIEVSVVSRADLERLDAALTAAAAARDGLQTIIDGFTHSVENLASVTSGIRSTGQPPQPANNAAMRAAAAAPKPVVSRAALATRPASEGQFTLSRAQRAIASALATHGELSYKQIGLMTGYSHTSGTFSNNISVMRVAGILEGSKLGIILSAFGHEILGSFEKLPEGRDLITWWMGKLPAAQGSILSALLEVWPDSLSNEQLAEVTGYSGSSGTFSNNKSKLRTADLMSGGKDAMTAADTLGAAYTSD